MGISECYDQLAIQKKQLICPGKGCDEDSESSQQVSDILGYMIHSALQSSNMKCILSLH